MKIRTDFVTNSSSSNFSVVLEIRSDDKIVRIEEDPFRYDPDSGGEAAFQGNLPDINSHLSSVKGLATWLADSIKGDAWGGSDSSSLRRRKAKFIQDATKAFQDVRKITSISVERHYDAWGEFADLCADNDETLVELATKYMQSSGPEKIRAKAALATYILTTEDGPNGDSFGVECIKKKYNWNGKNLDKIAERLCSNYGPGRVTGVERKLLDLRTGEYYDEAVFDLS